jgi:hypothetical protein
MPARTCEDAHPVVGINERKVGDRIVCSYGSYVPGDDRGAGGRDALGRPGRRARGVAFRATLVLFAVTWLTFCFGIIDYSAAFPPPGDTSGVDVGLLSVAYGAIAAVVLPMAFLAQVRTPQRAAAVQQIAAVTVAFALAGILGLDPLSFISVATLVIMLAVLLRLHPARPPLLPDTRHVNRPALILAAVAAIRGRCTA